MMTADGNGGNQVLDDKQAKLQANYQNRERV